jgi:hypothetical protein
MTALMMWSPHEDGIPGEWMPTGEGTILTASTRIIDALACATWASIARVAAMPVSASAMSQYHVTASQWAVLYRVDLRPILPVFARRCVFAIADGWPDLSEVVLRWLKTGDEALREAADAASEGESQVAWAIGWALLAAREPHIPEYAVKAAEAANRVDLYTVNKDNSTTQDAWLEAMVRDAVGDPDDDALLAELREPA